MRLALLLFLAASPAAAWDFTSSPVCTLWHDTAEAGLRVTYDPRLSEPYAITITRAALWAEAPVFSITFDGPRGLTISTDRQSLSGDRTTLTVTDRGFGNVLDGLEFNSTATARLGGDTLAFPLAGAAPEVQAFRACTQAPTV